MIFFYNISIILYTFFIRIAATWSKKAQQWTKGRNNLFEDLRRQLKSNENLIWIHSASVGEFEQAKPIIEALKQNHPSYKILATFFSPSGYNAAKKYQYIDYLSYLPVDTTGNAKRLVHLINPKLVIFIKYDFWYHHLKEIHKQGIPLFLVSAVFRPDQLFFKWYGRFYRNLLSFYNWIFVQDAASLQLLDKIKVQNSSLSGDTRFDRVIQIKENFNEIAVVEEFTKGKKVIVAGSTWPGDEALLAEWMEEMNDQTKMIIAPHEINEAHINELKNRFPQSVLYSQLSENGNTGKTQILIIDNIGLLSRLYQYATIAYVGGGFTKDGIHNILEAAVYGKPVVIGSNYKKYREAVELIQAGGAFSISNATELKSLFNHLLKKEAAYSAASIASMQYVYANGGATEKVLQHFYKNRLLTK